MVLARVIEPTWQKADTVRVLGEIGTPAPTVRDPVPGAGPLRAA